MRLPSPHPRCDRVSCGRLRALPGLLAVWALADPHPPVEPVAGWGREQGPPAFLSDFKN